MKVDFLGIPVDAMTMEQTIQKIDKSIQKGDHMLHCVINAGKVVQMQKDPVLKHSVVSSDMINADGQSILWAARFLGKEIPERVTGVDLMPRLVGLAAKRNYKCYFFGAREEIVSQVVENFRSKYGDEVIAGYRNGYFTPSEEHRIAIDIARSGAQLLFVALPSPKKENFLFDNRELLKTVNFTMGVGGTFDVVAGFTKRAPRWLQANGMEWAYRLMQEPRRMWKRYLFGNTLFIWLILTHAVKKTLAFDSN